MTPIDRRPSAWALAVFTIVLAGCSAPPAPVAPPKPVRVMAVAAGQEGDQTSFTGAVRARVEADLAFRVGGKVVRRHVELGQRVRAGDAIAELDAADYALGLAAAVAQQQAAAVDAAQAGSDAERFARLQAEGAMSAGDEERQRARAEAARERLTQARRQAELARNRAAYAVLRAPFDGIVTQLRLEVGQVVAEGQPVAALAANGEREIVIDVPESRVAQLRQASATASLWSGDGSRFEVVLRELSPSAAPGTRTYRARYRLPAAKDAELAQLGMTATVWLDSRGRPSERAPVAVLPASALHHRDGQPAVWTVDRERGLATRVPVEVVRFGQDDIVVRGLSAGAWVATAGVHKLTEGMQVTAVDAEGRVLAQSRATTVTTTAAAR
ncbi:MAG: efflux RND transporter periplasmic adaptor subunit [Burkholderiales bacterium]|jgi:multidrug efflux system membrane fusion protein|nr:efflux RND transporter periplasmic adaptor subunit [Burkholderiales bacterium]